MRKKRKDTRTIYTIFVGGCCYLSSDPGALMDAVDCKLTACRLACYYTEGLAPSALSIAGQIAFDVSDEADTIRWLETEGR